MSTVEELLYESPRRHCVASPGNDPAFATFLDGCLEELLG